MSAAEEMASASVAMVARELMERPGEWRFLVTSGSDNGPLRASGTNGQALRNAGVDPYAFEHTTRRHDDGTVSHWARYMGAHGEYADEDA